jgi:signal transduction histidine kinase
MTIAKNIFDKHGMEICVFSEAGKGTKIILIIPEVI